MSDFGERTRPISAQASDQFGGGGPIPTFATKLQQEFKGHDFTDIQYQEVQLYIEGVKVPYQSISVSCPYMEKPSAVITIPPYQGLTEIPRNYFPKVHIFFKDTHHELYLQQKGIEYGEAHVWKTLFSGVIQGSQYQKRDTGRTGKRTIQLQCVHRDYVMQEVTVKYGGRGIEATQPGQAGQSDTVAETSTFSSAHSTLEAMKGLRPPRSDYSVSNIKSKEDAKKQLSLDSYNKTKQRIKLDPSRYNSSVREVIEKVRPTELDPSILPPFLSYKYDDLKGIPSVFFILWNLLKRDTYLFDEKVTQAMRKMYIPLIDDGVKYFQRVSGHRIIEEGIDGSKVPLNETTLEENNITSDEDSSNAPKEIQLPPVFKTFLSEAFSADMAIRVMQNMTMFSGETDTLENVFMRFLRAMKYDMITLASPVQQINRRRVGVDKISKPLMPFYYSPTCNVFTPDMYHTLSVRDSTYGTPTRVKAHNDGAVLSKFEQQGRIEYRAPHEVRKAMSEAYISSEYSKDSEGEKEKRVKLANSLYPWGEVVGNHEIGQGVRHKYTRMPSWLSYLADDYFRRIEEEGEVEELTDGNSESGLEKLRQDWVDRYGYSAMNPWEKEDVNGIKPFQRPLFNTVEYDYALSLVETRTGQLNGPFNPYPIPGYPCDILDYNFEDPSYHAFVTGVTHNITGASISTSISFTSAITYDELQSYNLPPVYPWLRIQLGLDEKSSILGQTEKAKQIASDYYMDTLGVGYADPTYLYDFDEGRARQVYLNLNSGDFSDRTTENSDTWDNHDHGFGSTYQGSLILVRREIESMADIEFQSNADYRQLTFFPANQYGIQNYSKLSEFRFIDPGDREGDPNIQRAVDKEKPDSEEIRSFSYVKVKEVNQSTFLVYPSEARGDLDITGEYDEDGILATDPDTLSTTS